MMLMNKTLFYDFDFIKSHFAIRDLSIAQIKVNTVHWVPLGSKKNLEDKTGDYIFPAVW